VLLSRTIAKRRIANAIRPSWFGAWLPVLVDGIILLTLLLAVFPFVKTQIDALGGGALAIVLITFGLYFIPIQVVLIISALWATKSRALVEESADSQ
jgi:hypothetical protein